MSAASTDRTEALRLDRKHGGSWLARIAVEALVQEAAAPAETAEELRTRLVETAQQLAAARPDSGSVTCALARLVAAAHRGWELSPSELRRLVLDEARALLEGRDRAARSIAIQLAPRLENAVVLTHSASSTVREAVTHTPPKHIVCTVTQPHGEGRGFAADLTEQGLDVELVEDEGAAQAVANVTLLFVGADTIYRDGTLLNRRGTRKLAEAASAAGVPVVVASEMIKLAPFGPPDKPADPKHADLTPAELLTEIITEEGPVHGAEVAVLVDRTPFLREGYELLVQSGGR